MSFVYIDQNLKPCNIKLKNISYIWFLGYLKEINDYIEQCGYKIVRHIDSNLYLLKKDEPFAYVASLSMDGDQFILANFEVFINTICKGKTLKQLNRNPIYNMLQNFNLINTIKYDYEKEKV